MLSQFMQTAFLGFILPENVDRRLREWRTVRGLYSRSAPLHITVIPPAQRLVLNHPVESKIVLACARHRQMPIHCTGVDWFGGGSVLAVTVEVEGGEALRHQLKGIIQANEGKDFAFRPHISVARGDFTPEERHMLADELADLVRGWQWTARELTLFTRSAPAPYKIDAQYQFRDPSRGQSRVALSR